MLAFLDWSSCTVFKWMYIRGDREPEIATEATKWHARRFSLTLPEVSAIPIEYMKIILQVSVRMGTDEFR